MKTVILNISSTFKKTHEIPTYGSDGTKHRIGASGGDCCYLLNDIEILPFERTVTTNKYSGRVQRGLRFHREDIDMVENKIQYFLKNYVQENNLSVGKNFLNFQTQLISIFKERKFEELKNLAQKCVFSRKVVVVQEN